MPDPLVISQALLWLAIIGLGITVLALTRQIGILHERIAPIGALAVNTNIEVGQKAPRLDITDIDGELIKIGEVSETGRSTLVFFLSPSCPVCKALLPVVRDVLNRETDWLDGVFASDGGTLQTHRRIIAENKLGNWRYVISEALGRSIGVAKLPFAILIDGAGLVASKGLVNSREHIESLFEAKERGVASIQDYLANQS